MSFARHQYWVPRLRQLTKRVIRGCYGCKKFQVTTCSNPPTGKLPTDRTEWLTPFQVVGLDFAGPIGYKLKTKKEGKAYTCILLFDCSWGRAVHFELQPNQTAEEFIKHLKWFITSKGHPRKIYEYNKRTFCWRSSVDKRVGKTSFIHPLLAREEYLCASKVKSSFMRPTSPTNSVKVNPNRNLVCLTKKFMLSPESKSSYPGCQKFYQGKKMFSAYRGTYSRWGRRISIPELIIAPLTCKNSDWY